MTTPIELPVQASEAGALAEIIFELAGQRGLNDALRSRIHGRILARGFQSMTPLAASLERDPIHPDAFYIALERDLLLRIALDSSPSSGLFPRSLLIGRLRTERAREVVVNAIPFAPTDHEAIRTFAEQVGRDLLPRPGNGLPALRVHPGDALGKWHAALWHVVRSGWRRGWTATLVCGDDTDVTQLATYFTRFSISGDVTAVYSAIRQARGRLFEAELDLTNIPAGATPALITSALTQLRAQYVAVRVSPGASLAPLIDAARPFGATLTVDPAISGLTPGPRINYMGSGNLEEFAAKLRS